MGIYNINTHTHTQIHTHTNTHTHTLIMYIHLKFDKCINNTCKSAKKYIQNIGHTRSCLSDGDERKCSMLLLQVKLITEYTIHDNVINCIKKLQTLQLVF